MNNNGVLLQLSDDNGNAIELPSQGAKEFPRFLDGGIATENTDPAAYRATHSYLFSFAGSDTVYTLTVAGSAHEVDLLRNTLANVFIILFFVILIIATLASMIYSRYVTTVSYTHLDVYKRQLNFRLRIVHNLIILFITQFHKRSRPPWSTHNVMVPKVAQC